MDVHKILVYSLILICIIGGAFDYFQSQSKPVVWLSDGALAPIFWIGLLLIILTVAINLVSGTWIGEDHR